MNWASERGKDEVEKLFPQFRVRVTEMPDPRSRVGGSDSDDRRIQTQQQAIRVHCTLQLYLSLLLSVHRHHLHTLSLRVLLFLLLLLRWFVLFFFCFCFFCVSVAFASFFSLILLYRVVQLWFCFLILFFVFLEYFWKGRRSLGLCKIAERHLNLKSRGAY